MENEKIRIQKIIADAGIASRRKAEELISRGAVTVNGKRAQLGDKADPVKDKINVAAQAKRIYNDNERRGRQKMCCGACR